MSTKSEESPDAFVRRFEEMTASDQSVAGAKGGTLALLFQRGYPVPNGFAILPQSFDGDELRLEAWATARTRAEELRSGRDRVALAVRSSAAVEDSTGASFAGEFDTVLDVRTDDDLRVAIGSVRESRHGERVRAYLAAQGEAVPEVSDDPEMAVVVQELVSADFAGVLFTADPVTGSRTLISGNYVHGMGGRLVSGEANPHTFTLRRPYGRYEGPKELRRFARRLYRLAQRLERELGGAQDIEWAVSGGKLFLLQSRPITTLQARNPATGDRNDSMLGDFLWSNGNIGEAFHGVMTPFTASMVDGMWRCNGVSVEQIDYPMGGQIGGRPYYNISVQWSGIGAMGMEPERFLRIGDETFGRIPAELEVPTIPLTPLWVFRKLLPMFVSWSSAMRSSVRRAPSFVAETPALVAHLLDQIQAAQTRADLLAVWRRELDMRRDVAWLMSAAGLNEQMTRYRKLFSDLAALVGEADANALLSGMTSRRDPLASLGMLIGLTELGRGEISREEYLRRHGHRGPDEFEFAAPRPYEDPDWVDRRLAELEGGRVDPAEQLEEQRVRHEAAWARLVEKVPRKAKYFRKKLDKLGGASRLRESARSEAIRLFGVFRAFAVRAGEITGLGDDIFFLSVDEVVRVLAGDDPACLQIAARKETYDRYRSLPPYPSFIRGRFDPFEWAADPNRRSDYFDATAAVTALPSTELTDDDITGFAGAVGRVEGLVRVLASPDQGHLLQPGEVLVAMTTNIGWSPLFPRAAAVVTDVGAPLSHAAIVARELGIPAVVGCSDATMRLSDGDRVLVDGGRGIVRVLGRADAATPEQA